jgi:hypothetical protein
MPHIPDVLASASIRQLKSMNAAPVIAQATCFSNGVSRTSLGVMSPATVIGLLLLMATRAARKKSDFVVIGAHRDPGKAIPTF